MDNPNSQHSNKERQIGNYKIIDTLGKGGMGVVYKVWDTKLKRELALKTLLSHDIKSIQRFLREAQTISQLQHPNIVRMYTLENDRGTHFFTMDYITGTTLTEYCQNLKDFKSMAQLIYKIAMAIDYAHNQNIIHRDLKPDNIIIDSNGTPYVMDFGLAKITSKKDKKLTDTGQILGTTHFMSPEQALANNRQVDNQSDVYSLGAILYFVLTKEPPVNGDSLVEILTKIVEKNVILPRKLNSQIPLELEKICLKALAKNKKHRYASMSQLATDIQKYCDHKKISVSHNVYWQRYKRGIALALQK